MRLKPEKTSGLEPQHVYIDETTHIEIYKRNVDDADYMFRLRHKIRFGGALLVYRDKSKKPLIKIRQDKCAFFQYCQYSK